REGGEAVAWVSDTGRGVDGADLEEIFTKFFRSASVQGDAIPGVGLGLAITKTIVDAHGGTIDVESEPGRGSTFTVRLPLSAEGSASAGPPTEPVTVAAASGVA
ncbi:MAG: HAMP domain-containing histidine kinase, partial [Marmoricola sp.]|nr:HAMP domain-containing histidine kinase [Marmoricola sp.]